MKRVGLLSVLVLPVFLVCSANALTYQDGSDVQFTFNSTLSISLSDADIVIGNLIPGQDEVSNTVGITVNTNNLYGYTLSATVGNATKDYRDLRHTNGTANFASLAVDSDLATLANETSSVWGYATSSNGTTWSNYNGLPKYDDTEHVAELKVTDGAAADDITSFRIGAKAIEGQLAGDYSNVINFKVTTNVGKIYMQDITASNCPTDRTLVYDARDESAYYVQEITTGNTTLCWMTSNLNLAGGTALYSDTSNVPDGYPQSGHTPFFTLPLSSNEKHMTSATPYVYNGSNDYCEPNHPCYGYYSYAAATAGVNPQSGDSEYDICPKGWRMPHKTEYEDLTAVYDTKAALVGAPWYANLAGMYWGETDFGDEGIYYSMGETEFVVYWTSTAYYSDEPYGGSVVIPEAVYAYAFEIGYGGETAPPTKVELAPRWIGSAVRCVLK